MKYIFNCILVFTVFILGYIFGKIGIDSILNKLLVNYEKIDLIQLVGFGSSIVTLILFVTYIIGRCLLIKKMEITLEETVEVSYKEEIARFSVVEEYNLGNHNSEFIYLSSTEPLRWIKFYEYKYNDKKNYRGELLEERKVLKNVHKKIRTIIR
ncbi:hypothetical protein [Rossellomorea marisflavi]|uniref:hypothetical protein n=1 Tax=Rossellomorea marisflavi TaxID=189381 RepID=UPI003459B45B